MVFPLIICTDWLRKYSLAHMAAAPRLKIIPILHYAIPTGQQQYQRYEAGHYDIPTDILKKLCLLYKVSVDYILELLKGLKQPR